MLKSIRLKNFQSHENSFLEFHEGFNLITGASDNGKSSIIRALSWIRTNKPKGTSFIRKEQKKVVVEIIDDKDNKIGRYRSQSDTGGYSFGFEDFTVMGGNVPEQVKKGLNLSDINIQLQLDGHYLILDSPGKIANIFNEITKLDKLAIALQKLKHMKMTVQHELVTFKSELQETDNYLNSGIQKTLSKALKLYNRVIVWQGEEKSLSGRIHRLNECIRDIKVIERERLDEEDMDFIDNEVKSVENRVKKIEELKSKIFNLNDLLDNMNKIEIEKEEIGERREGLIKSMMDMKKQLKLCPYCGQSLDTNARKVLLEK